jgi:hypothetical protein
MGTPLLQRRLEASSLPDKLAVTNGATDRQRLLLRVLATKAAEAGSHADELRQLLGALDYNRHYERGMG